MEMLIVIALLAVVATFMVANLDVIFGEAQGDAERMKVDKGALSIALMRYSVHVGSLPTTEEGLQVLLTPPGHAADRWRGPYASEAELLDSWHRPYQYRRPGLHNPGRYDLWTMGPDGQNGTSDDIGNWK
jgi:general secretion pathway protein G